MMQVQTGNRTYCTETKMTDQRRHNTTTVADGTETATSPLLVGKREAARLTGISARSIDRLISAGKFLPPTRLGGRVLFDRASLVRWVEEGCQPVKSAHQAGGTA
jgi:excisionase family DNA binding protein